MREVDSAIWTSGEPVSLSARLYSAISLPLTSVSTVKPNRDYTGRRFSPVYETWMAEPSERGSAPARHDDGPSMTIAWACPSDSYLGGMSSTGKPDRTSSVAPG